MIFLELGVELGHELGHELGPRAMKRMDEYWQGDRRQARKRRRIGEVWDDGG